MLIHLGDCYCAVYQADCGEQVHGAGGKSAPFLSE